MTDTDLVRAYIDGLVAVAVSANAALPVNASDPLPVDFVEVGALTSEGVTEATSQDRTGIFVWQGNNLARSVPGQFAKQFTFAAAETNLVTLGVQLPGSTIDQTAEGLTVAERPPVSDVRPWVLHGMDGASRALRVVVPRGEVTERGDLVLSSDAVTVYQWTLSCYVDPSGNVAHRYYVDSDMAVAGYPSLSTWPALDLYPVGV